MRSSYSRCALFGSKVVKNSISCPLANSMIVSENRRMTLMTPVSHTNVADVAKR